MAHDRSVIELAEKRRAKRLEEEAAAERYEADERAGIQGGQQPSPYSDAGRKRILPPDPWRRELGRLIRAERAPTPQELAAARAMLDRVAEEITPSELFKVEGIDQIFAPLPPVPWLVQRLDICPGAPVLFAGFGFSGKTLAAQSLALAVAGGGRVWGDYSIGRRGRVVHLDYEQGLRLTAERYQRLARALGLTVDDLRDQLGVAALPSLSLSNSRAQDALARACDGAALLIVDSLRAAAPDLDENSSDVRRVLDMLGAVSQRTGVVPVVLHHARKPSQNADGGAKMSIRGSSAIFDACSSVLVFSASKGEPVVVTHEKARTSGILAEDFSLEIEDVAIDGDPRGGLRVTSVGVAPIAEQRADRQRERRNEIHDRVLAFIASNPGCSGRAVRGADIEGAKSPNTIMDALGFLESQGRLKRGKGPKGSDAWFVTGGRA